MKKIVLMAMLIISVLSFAACGKQTGGNQTGDNKTDDKDTNFLDGSLEELINKIYETADVDDSFREYLQSGTFNEEVTAERAEYYLGKSDIEFEEALASEPMIQPGAYSMVLLRVKEGADIEAIKKDIKENVNPNKWICVGVQEDNIIVDNIDNIVFLVMSDQGAIPLHEAFLSLSK